jgi:hypothetical protein
VVVEAEKVEPLPALGQLYDPGLVGVQVQPQRGQDLGHQPAGVLGLLSCPAEDDEVVAIPDERPEAATVPRPRLVQHVQRDIGQQRGNR